MTISLRSRGRPKTFDRQQALETAVLLFWRHGYEGASIADLTAAMGVTPPTLYAAFGSKEGLYREALRQYADDVCFDRIQALRYAPTAYGATEIYLRESATHFSHTDAPSGCMISMGALQSASENADIARVTALFRTGALEGFIDRYAKAQITGELPRSVDAFGLAHFYSAVVHGMSTQARDGSDAAALHAVVDIALGAWPGRREPDD